jgi:hypothetical protein
MASSIRHALRRLWRDRTVTVIALGVLALGLGANTALFAVVNAVLIRNLPYPSADRLVVVRVSDPEFRDRHASFPVNDAHPLQRGATTATRARTSRPSTG